MNSQKFTAKSGIAQHMQLGLYTGCSCNGCVAEV